jgi:hypothetical protein
MVSGNPSQNLHEDAHIIVITPLVHLLPAMRRLMYAIIIRVIFSVRLLCARPIFGTRTFIIGDYDCDERVVLGFGLKSRVN